MYVFADGIQRLKPKLIFHGQPPPIGIIYSEEQRLYSPDVAVEFNETAYNNEELFGEWIAEELGCITSSDEHLLVMNVATFHQTDKILSQLR